MKILILSAILGKDEEVFERKKPIKVSEWPELRIWHQYYIKNWINSGHEVTAINFLRERKNLDDFDLCLLLSGGTNFRRMYSIPKKSIPIFMYCEDTWEHYERDLNYKRIFLRTGADLALEPSLQNLSHWRNDNLAVVWFPYAIDNDYFYPRNLSREYDIFFSGKGRSERLRILDKLERAKFKCDFHVFEAGRLFEKRFPPITQQIESKSGAFSSYIEGLNKAKIGLEITKKKEMAERPLETLACKALSMCERNPGIEKLFEEDKEIVLWDSWEELYKKTKYYLEHKEERERIVEAGYKKVLENHLFKHRIEYLVKLYEAIQSEKD